MGPLALRVTATCIFTCTMISTLTGGCRAEHVPRACDSCDSKQRSRQQHGGRRRAQHIRIACANCCTRLNTASVRRTPYRPAPPPSAKGATWASIRLHRSVPEADRLLSGKRCSAGRRLDLLACLQGGLGGPGPRRACLAVVDVLPEGGALDQPAAPGALRARVRPPARGQHDGRPRACMWSACAEPASWRRLRTACTAEYAARKKIARSCGPARVPALTLRAQRR